MNATTQKPAVFSPAPHRNNRNALVRELENVTSVEEAQDILAKIASEDLKIAFCQNMARGNREIPMQVELAPTRRNIYDSRYK